MGEDATVGLEGQGEQKFGARKKRAMPSGKL
ncbi:hypothetical protein CCACVL1_10600 [Corchorus capsularis]|uniref:Uncharacterized protein n=1 Tax=Corchorus capsularis TaxID=210143 RepID=A0A1R3IQM5_COCAP|nr:hypothetical protein CCACVL1_10600 [Corchorus capsularis]